MFYKYRGLGTEISLVFIRWRRYMRNIYCKMDLWWWMYFLIWFWWTLYDHIYLSRLIELYFPKEFIFFHVDFNNPDIGNKIRNEFRFIIFLSNIFLFPTLNVNLYQFSIYIRRNLKLLFSLPNIPHLIRHQLQSI